ncbi:glycosyltransferase family 4 protein [Latilactobacillus sakei]|uniref:glycosyltransferase family 4 protein n=1 Tax=Latilactobacillus sakei TaxID=1599 RepID=UPI00033E6BB2|nr:glycosyltransferase family 4 protein [Latilactobacillus sakei]EOR84447.1 putative glycosyl transferase [Latilactobacillus sakei subsp. sakei LS25]PKX63770.1 glycosyltransferase family 1 protein [Latilactobacillus sakei]PKX67796.1 glycosyltransferase family 1 protein [Latilactobacillus sakei]SOB39624.1 putative glycosyl transferase [Latilactobacillus sakei]
MIYLAEWDGKKQKSWSGTTYSLLRALEKNNSISSIDININTYTKVKYLLLSGIITGKFTRNLIFNAFYQKDREKKIIKEVQSIDSKNILQIGDIANLNNSMIYQDLSLSFLLKIKEFDPDSFKLSGFSHFKDDELRERNEIQLERYNTAKYILTMSHSLRNHLIEDQGFNENKVIYVGGGINVKPDEAKQKVSKNRRNILFVGRDFLRKGGDLTVSAFKLLKRQEEYKDLSLYIAGPKELSDEYLGEGIHFLGDMSSKELEEYFNICDIFCMPSRFEAYGLVFAEALTHGLPCIGLNKFDMPYFIEDGVSGYLLKSQDGAKQLSDKIDKLLRNEDIFKYVNSNLEEYRREYSWDTVAKRILEVSNEN